MSESEDSTQSTNPQSTNPQSTNPQSTNPQSTNPQPANVQPANVQATNSQLKSGTLTPKSDKKGVEVNICQVSWFDSAQTYKIANASERTSALTFTDDDLNYFARVLYAESSGSQSLPSADDRKIEKEALINAFYFRLNRKGYPSNAYIATTFTMVCNARNQFQSVMPTPAPKLTKSASGVYKHLNKMECSDLQESIDAIKSFLASGPNPKYVYDNFRAGGSGTAGIRIGGSRFWLSRTGKELTDANP
jgi:hypothetical protein